MHIDYIPQIKNAAKLFSLDPIFIAAVVKTESNFDTYAFRYESHYVWLYKHKLLAKEAGITASSMKVLQKSSHGLMQVMGATACEMGIMEEPEGRIQMLYRPEIGLRYGCKYLAYLRARDSLKTNADLYSAYNAGFVRKQEDGSYSNWKAVDAMCRNYEEIYKIYSEVLLDQPINS